MPREWLEPSLALFHAQPTKRISKRGLVPATKLDCHACGGLWRWARQERRTASVVKCCKSLSFRPLEILSSLSAFTAATGLILICRAL